jgi:hypothetical protein
MDTTILITLISTGGALVGSVIGSVVTYNVQRRLLDAEAKRNTFSHLLEKRLGALQHVNLALDFAFGNIGRTQGGPVGDLFTKIVHDMPMHIAFLPEDIRTEARELMFKFFAGSRDGTVNLEQDALTQLRAKVLTLIDENYKLYS